MLQMAWRDDILTVCGYGVDHGTQLRSIRVVVEVYECPIQARAKTNHKTSSETLIYPRYIVVQRIHERQLSRVHRSRCIPEEKYTFPALPYIFTHSSDFLSMISHSPLTSKYRARY